MDKLKAVLCALFGHPPVVTYCFGYLNCARCRAQVGDTLGGLDNMHGLIVLHHKDCEECAKVKLRWIDRLLTRMEE